LKTIELVISPQGETTLQTKGFFGSECQQASRFVETALGKKTSETLTSEFHQIHSKHQNHIKE